MITSADAIRKLRRPPSAPNWVRYIHKGTQDSAIAMARFAISSPRISLTQVYKLLSDMACLKTSLSDALHGLEKVGNPLVRRLGREILTSFAAYNEVRLFDGIRTLNEFCVNYPLDRGVFVPVRPTFIIVEDDGLTPVFIIGWTSLPFTDFQKRLLSTIIYNAVLTLTDFIGRDAEIVCFPRAKYSKSERMPRAWKVSNYKPFSAAELSAHLDRYGNALDLAADMIRSILGDDA
ncbi:hypothetical protein [Polymorphobacter megasporae]|uniref:hypothetical protein n=1 Tax=Glacieibacterium megasporae TaxID=2835787 RepID=UPI001C1E0098|nr:hypothetical protein [Polymorphobacter megasporae]UAJ09582.1 hypothetical protein KTC28_14880 [Polymorphobacter megasporae]